MVETQVTIIKDSDPDRALFNFAKELSKTLIMMNKSLGKEILFDYKSDEEREIFFTGYVAAMADYLGARMSGRLQEPTFRIGVDDA